MQRGDRLYGTQLFNGLLGQGTYNGYLHRAVKLVYPKRKAIYDTGRTSSIEIGIQPTIDNGRLDTSVTLPATGDVAAESLLAHLSATRSSLQPGLLRVGYETTAPPYIQQDEYPVETYTSIPVFDDDIIGDSAYEPSFSVMGLPAHYLGLSSPYDGNTVSKKNPPQLTSDWNHEAFRRWNVIRATPDIIATGSQVIRIEAGFLDDSFTFEQFSKTADYVRFIDPIVRDEVSTRASGDLATDLAAMEQAMQVPGDGMDHAGMAQDYFNQALVFLDKASYLMWYISHFGDPDGSVQQQIDDYLTHYNELNQHGQDELAILDDERRGHDGRPEALTAVAEALRALNVELNLRQSAVAAAEDAIAAATTPEELASAKSAKADADDQFALISDVVNHVSDMQALFLQNTDPGIAVDGARSLPGIIYAYATSSADVTVKIGDTSDARNRIAIVDQRMVAEGVNASVCQALELTLSVGPEAHAAIYDIDVNCGAIKAYEDELSQQTAGANGAHRMKGALAVVSIAHETQSQHSVTTQLKKSYSAPQLTASVGGVSTSGTNVTISLSGQVQDQYAGLVQNSALSAVHVYRGAEQVGSISLQQVSDGMSDFAPYAKHFTFSGSVTMPAWVGDYDIIVQTDPNEMGAHGTARVPVSLHGTQPVPEMTTTLGMTMPATLSTTTVNTFTTTVPDLTVGGGGTPQSLTFTETGVGTRVFTAPGGYTLTIYSVDDAGDDTIGTITAAIALNGVTQWVGDFTETGPATHVYQRQDGWMPQISGPTTFAYQVNWDGDWQTTGTVRVTLPTAIAGSGASPVTLTGSAANDVWTFTGTFNGNPVKVVASQVIGTSRQVSVAINDRPVATMSANVSALNAAGTVGTSYTVSDVYQVASYDVASTGNVAAMNCTTADSEWEPYRVRVDVPAELSSYVTDRTWTIQGNQVTLSKVGDDYYVMDQMSGNPAVYVDPVLNPTTDPRHTEGGGGNEAPPADPPLPEGWAAYSGEVPGVKAVVYQRVGKNAPPSITLTVTFEDDGKRIRSVSSAGNDLRNMHWVVTPTDAHAQTVDIACALQPAQATPGTLVGVKAADFSTAVLAGYLKTYAAGPACWVWQPAQEEGDSYGWVWSQGQHQEISPAPALWTIPENGTGEVAITDAVAKALNETGIPDPSADFAKEKKRILLSNLTALVGKGAINHWDKDQAQHVYTWMQDNVFEPAQAGDVEPRFKQQYTIFQALDMGRVIAAYNAAHKSEFDAKVAKDGERAQYAELVMDYKRLGQPEPYLAVLRIVDDYADPFSAALSIAAGEPILPVDEAATWTGVLWQAGYLVIDRVPFVKLARKGVEAVKKARLVFRRSDALPGAAKDVRKLAKEEVVVAGKKVKNLIERDANAVNDELRAKGFSSPPYAAGTKVKEFVLDEDVVFYRTFRKVNVAPSGGPQFRWPKGRWIGMQSDIAGLSPAEIKKLYCLPDVPTHYVEVRVKKGTRIRKGVAGAQPQWGSPTNGGTQYELADFDPQSSTVEFIEKGLIPWH